MRKTRVKKIREAFETVMGFLPGQRHLLIYKKHWRRWKKDLKNN